MQILTVFLLSLSVCSTHARNLLAAQDLSLPLIKRCVTCSPFAPLCPPCNPAWDCVQIPQTCDSCAHAICVKPDDAATTTAAGSWEAPSYGQETPAASAESGTTTWSETTWSETTWTSSTSSTPTSEATLSEAPTSSQPASTTPVEVVSTPSTSPTVATVTTSFGNKNNLVDASRTVIFPALAIFAGMLFGSTF